MPKWPQNSKKQHKKSIFWLFWTISAERMGPMIWLRAYSRLRHSAYLWALATFKGPFEGAKMAPKWTEKHKKPVFWLFRIISAEIMGLMFWF
jgi:hypothetical protein